MNADEIIIEMERLAGDDNQPGAIFRVEGGRLTAPNIEHLVAAYIELLEEEKSVVDYYLGFILRTFEMETEKEDTTPEFRQMTDHFRLLREDFYLRFDAFVKEQEQKTEGQRSTSTLAPR